MADVKAVLLYDSVAWMDGDERHEETGRGETIELPSGEFDRLSDAKKFPPDGAVAKPGSKAAKTADEPATETEPAP